MLMVMMPGYTHHRTPLLQDANSEVVVLFTALLNLQLLSLRGQQLRGNCTDGNEGERREGEGKI